MAALEEEVRSLEISAMVAKEDGGLVQLIQTYNMMLSESGGEIKKIRQGLRYFI